jgi:exopolysaccharide production protein ExoQ
MAPPLALALTLFLIGYLLRHDYREKPRVSIATWIPTVWLMILGSRQVSQWLESGPTLSARVLEEGSPIDRAVYGGLLFVGFCILASRRVRVGEVAKNNFPIVLFLLYEGISVLWSDFPLVALKRWSKALGDVVMVLIIWSGPFPMRSVTAVIRRCAYVLIPLSFLFCKYYENLGRTMDDWGNSGYTGVTTDKNMFGYLLFAFGLYFFAALINSTRRLGHEREGTLFDRGISILFLVMIGWLFPISNSKTATVAFAVGVAIIVAVQFATVRRHLWSYAFAAILLAPILDELFSVKSAIFEASGRDATLTGRTGLWETLLKEPINPLVGVGYGSFWLGERLTRFWAMYKTSPPIQAHNGYLEVYLNLGLIGLTLLAGVLWAGLKRMRNKFVSSQALTETRNDRTIKTFGLAYGIAYLFYNVSEATFQGNNLLFVIFLILAWKPNRSVR